MSEYSWKVKAAWIGIENDTGREPVAAPGETLPEPTRTMTVLHEPAGCVGVVVRSGRVQACGHFCYVDVQIGGCKVTASGAEDRIYPFHSVKLSELGGVCPKGMIPALGFALDGNTYCFLYTGRVVSLVGPAKDGLDKALAPVDPELWQPGWAKATGGWEPEPVPAVPDSFFRKLTADETFEFRQYIRQTYKPGDPIDPVWHPVCRDECRKMNEENKA